jgi:Fic family protein
MKYKFQFSPEIVRYIQIIERVNETIHYTVIPPVQAEILRMQAQIRSTHYSTRIEGNRLTLKETEQVVRQGKKFPGKERDVKEVEQYYQAIDVMESLVAANEPISEGQIQKIHSILYYGKKAKATSYRDGQNVIRELGGGIVYLPPEAKDVPQLMQELVSWIKSSEKEMPIPVIAGIAHYAFETIHPFYDGNGRTGRMLSTWILYKGGYDLGRFYSLEEFYANDLNGYYSALKTHPHENYYFGRHEADMTPWLTYFLKGMSIVFESVAERVREDISKNDTNDETIALLRTLDHRARRVLSLFHTQEYIQSSEVASILGVSIRQARNLLSDWIAQEWLDIEDNSNRGRKYRLAKKYQKLIR